MDMVLKFKYATGNELNKLIGEELRAYNNEPFNEDKTYTVFNDGCIDGADGHQILREFISDEDYKKIKGQEECIE